MSLGVNIRDAPDSPATVDLVVSQNPVGQIERPVGGCSDADGAEVLVADDEGLGDRLVGGPFLLQSKSVDTMVPPAAADQITDELLGESGTLVSEETAGSLARPGQHGQGSGNLTVPRGEGMQSLAAIAKSIAEIATANGVHQPARGPAVGIVIDGKQMTERIDA